MGEELPSDDDRGLTLVAFEGEYAFGYTKVTGEVVRDRLETGVGTETAYAWFVQGVQTLAPRWFVAGRQEGTSSPPLRTGIDPSRRPAFHTTEATVGFHISPELTLRSSLVSRKPYTRTAWDQQAAVALVWARRWW